jgi:hypothetical protein
MDLAVIRRRCQARLASLDLPRPFDAAELCRRLGARRGRPIVLLPMAMPTDGDGPYGMLLSYARADYIVYEQRTTPLHQEQIVLHEVGHLVCGHTSPEVPEDAGLRHVFPNLDPGMVRRVLGRSAYSTEEEAEAEMLATLILERVDRRQRTRLPVDPAIAAALRRIEDTL